MDVVIASFPVQALKECDTRWGSRPELMVLFGEGAVLVAHDGEVFDGRAAIIRRLNAGGAIEWHNNSAQGNSWISQVFGLQIGNFSPSNDNVRAQSSSEDNAMMLEMTVLLLPYCYNTCRIKDSSRHKMLPEYSPLKSSQFTIPRNLLSLTA
jgi:hypothetical protein